ncbi:MAG TPA: ZIP family metal transporter [Candidatus Binatia bacterium]|nr:ZIP family metal transporter [Candidatus Binatia bacterium]
MDSFTSSLLLGVAAGSANVLGGVMVVARRGPWDPRILHGFVALSAGFMLAAALLRMGPEAVELTRAAPLLILAGYLLVHLFEHTIAPHFHFGEETHPHLVVGSSIWASAFMGLVVHSLFDGISIASGFLISPALGLLVFAAIILHKAPEGFAIASVMVAAGVRRSGAFASAVAVGLASVAGVLAAQALSEYVGAALALSTGVTLYVAASDLIPEVNKEEGAMMALLVFAGVALFYASELCLSALGLA